MLFMKALKIITDPDKRLRKKSESVHDFDNQLKQFSEAMLATMYKEKGIGLAAPQVNKLIRLIVLDTSENRDEPMVFVNPVIDSHQGNVDSNEGCLSVPDIKADIRRFESILFSAQSIHGKNISFAADGLLSVCLQHEIDHLDGKLFIDQISDIKLKRIRKKIKKQKKAEAIEKQNNARII